MPRAQDRIIRKIGQMTLTDGQRQTIDIPRDYDLEGLVVYFTGTSTLSVAGTAVRNEAPTQAISFINVKANGSDLLDGLTGTMAHRAGLIRRGQLFPLSAPSDATAAARAFHGGFILDRSVIDGIRAKDGAFPTNGLSTFQVEIIAGNATDMFTGTPTGTMTMTVSVGVIQLKEKAGADGKRSLPRVWSKRTQRTDAFASSNSAYEIVLNTGNILRGVLLRAYGASTAGEPSNTGLNNVKLQVGNEIVADLPAAMLQGIDASSIDVSSVPTGYYLLDLMNMGAPATKLADGLDLRAGQVAKLILDVTGATNQKIDTSQWEYVPYNPSYWGIQTK